MTRQAPDTIELAGESWQLASWSGARCEAPIRLETTMESTALYRGRIDHYELAGTELFHRSTYAYLRGELPPLPDGVEVTGTPPRVTLHYRAHRVPFTGVVAIRRSGERETAEPEVFLELAEGRLHRVRCVRRADTDALRAQLGVEVIDDAVVDLFGRELRSTTSELRLADTAITSLEPLRAATQVARLDLRNTRVSDLRPLASMRALEVLDLTGARAVVDLAPLAGLPLTTLHLGDTAVSDVSALAGLDTLEKLYLDGTPVTDLAPLADLTRLTTLTLPAAVSDLTPLANLSALGALDISGRPIADLTPLRRLVGLRQLAARDTQIADLSPLGGRRLDDVDLSRTYVADLAPLARHRIRQLAIAGTHVEDLRPLAACPLVELDATGCRIAELPPWTTLQVLRIGGTRITAIPPSPGLRVLDIGHLDLGDLDAVAGLRTLKELVMPLTGITDLAPLRRANLERIDVRWSLLRSLDGLQSQQWTLRRLELDVDKLPMLAELRDMLITHLVIEGRAGAVTDLSALGGLRTLEEIELVDVDVDPDALAAFRAARPRVSFVVSASE